MGGFFPFAQLLEGAGSPRFSRVLEMIQPASSVSAQMVRAHFD